MLVNDIAGAIEEFAPLHFQESYDNAGLCIGNKMQNVTGVLVCIDITEEVINEATKLHCNMIVSHHPLIFSGIKRINGNNLVERCIIKAIQNNIALYSAHTNLDAMQNGVNAQICQKIGLENCKIIEPAKNKLRKLVFFVPAANAENVRDAVFKAGAGQIGNYDNCSFTTEGSGTFRGNENANPFVGTVNTMHTEPEMRIEVIIESHNQAKVVSALLQSHPYEDVAFDIFSLENQHPYAGAGMIGELTQPLNETAFLQNLKKIFFVPGIRHTALLGKEIKRVAVCGGSGSSLLSQAIQLNADVFVSSDFKYHQFFEADKKIIIADIGHYESEQFTKDIIYNLLVKKFPKFAVHFSSINTNPINYL